MSSKVLFQITEEQLETGLRGFPVGYCPTSTVSPDRGLFYRGKSVAELGSRSPEEVIYLLMQGREGTHDEVNAYFHTLNSHAELQPGTRRAIEQMMQLLPPNTHPMKLFEIALLIVGSYEGMGDYRDDAERLIAKAPLIAAMVINGHAGWGTTPPSNPHLGYMENFAAMLNVPNKEQRRLKEAFRIFNVLHFDHGGGNLSTFVGKAVASGLEDLYGSITSAMCALEGPRHGKANQDCLQFLEELLGELGDAITHDSVEQAIRARLARRQLVFGFGHAVLRVEDPRATFIYRYLETHYADHPLVKLGLVLREAGTRVLKENPKISNPYPNIDAISGVLLAVSGFLYPEYFTVLFGLSRLVGIARQIIYERLEARGGKGTPIVRPKYLPMSH